MRDSRKSVSLSGSARRPSLPSSSDSPPLRQAKSPSQKSRSRSATEAYSKDCSATSAGRQEPGPHKKASLKTFLRRFVQNQLEQACSSRSKGIGGEGRAVGAKAADQKKGGSSHEQGSDRQGQAERQGRFQIELGRSLGSLCCLSFSFFKAIAAIAV